MKSVLSLILSLLFITAVFAAPVAEAKPLLKPKRHKISSYQLLLPYHQFRKLTRAHQVKYIKKIQNITYQFENQMNKNRKRKDYADVWSLLFPNAYALDESWCVIGGMARPTYGGPCNTKGRGAKCDGGADDPNKFFQCGQIYGNVCVLREKITDLSQRCHTAAQNQEVQGIPSQEQYERIKTDLEKINTTLCSPPKKASQKEPCALFQEQLDKVRKLYDPSAPAAAASVVPAPAHQTGQGDSQNPPAAPEPVGIQCQNESPGDKGSGDPQLKIDDASFSEHLTVSLGLCGEESADLHFSVKDGMGTTHRFYLNNKSELCQEITAPKARYKTYSDAIKKFIEESDVVKCTDYVSCADGFAGKMMAQLTQLKNSKASVNSGLCPQGNCPESKALKACEKPLADWMKPNCHGGDSLLWAPSFTEFQTLSDGAFPNGSLDNAALSKLEQEKGEALYELCKKVYEQDCKTYFSGFKEMVVQLRTHYSQELQVSRSSQNGSLRSILEHLSRIQTSETSCSPDTLKGCQAALDDMLNLATEPLVDRTCGTGLTNLQDITVGPAGAVRTRELRDSEGKTIAKITYDKNSVSIQSVSPKNKSLKATFKDGHRHITAHSGPHSTEYGSFDIENMKCSDDSNNKVHDLGKVFPLESMRYTYSLKAGCPQLNADQDSSLGHRVRYGEPSPTDVDGSR
ncbi:MAG: hypothetical protein KDD61_04100 [Bdellovibrionales bacterium]|nr:hypothetical protein [Bdellovibrionales bacterium]